MDGHSIKHIIRPHSGPAESDSIPFAHPIAKIISMMSTSSFLLSLTSLLVLICMASASRPFGVTGRSFVTKTRVSVLNIRGGAVHESTTLTDLESRLQTAALQNKLTIIDFTATW